MAVAMSCVITAGTSHARVDLLPQKVIIEPRQRSGEITVLNVGETQGLYRVSTIAYRQNPDGSYVKLEEPLSPEFDPSKHIRISPSQFELPPKGRQKVRISVRRPADLPDGEYRFHLAATRYDTPQQEDEQDLDGNLSIAITMNLGVSIPVVVRNGEGSVEAQITDVEYLPPEDPNDESDFGKVQVKFKREGNFGALGRLEIIHEDEKIGTMSNMNIFSENDTRIARVPMRVDPRGLGNVQIIYKDDVNGKIYDERGFSF